MEDALDNVNSLGPAMRTAQAGIPVIFLDVRPRPPPLGMAAVLSKAAAAAAAAAKAKADPREEAAEGSLEKAGADGTAKRQALIDHATAHFSALCDEMLEAGVSEMFITCTLAYFHDALFGDGDANTTETAEATEASAASGSEVLARKGQAVPLREAIRRARAGSGAVASSGGSGAHMGIPPATPDQVCEASK